MLLLALLAPTQAAQIVVCPTSCTHTTINAAIQAAAPNDEIEVLGGVYDEVLVIDRDLSIAAVSSAATVNWFEPHAEPAVVNVRPGVNVRLSSLVITGLHLRGIHVEAGARVELHESYVSVLGVQVDGGGAYVDAGTLEAHNVIFDRNRVGGQGGHLYLHNSDLVLSNVDLLGGNAFTGGAIYAHTTGGNTFSAQQVRMVGNRTLSTGGAMTLSGPLDVTLSDSTFDDNRAEAGGVLYTAGPADVGPIVNLRDSVFRRNEAGSVGGAIYLTQNGRLAARDNRFEHNQAAQGGALNAQGVSSVFLRRNLFCANGATNLGGAVYLGSGRAVATSSTWANNVFLENHATEGGGVYVDQMPVKAVQNHFLGNSATRASAMRATATSGVRFRSNLVAYNQGTAVLLADGANVGFNAWYGNRRDVPGYGHRPGVYADPQLQLYTQDDNCTNDVLWHTAYSPLVDQGRRSRNDPDGSRADIGAFGGPMAGNGAWDDLDEDGSPALYDCDDDDPEISPLERETWYDGIDQNCDGASDFDRDGDGHDFDEYGGLDCDDRDAGIAPGLDEITYDGIDQNCDGVDLTDVDGDGFESWEVGGDDCDDFNRDVHPLAVDRNDQVDVDCNGYIDIPRDLIPDVGCAVGLDASPVWWLALLAMRRRRGDAR